MSYWEQCKSPSSISGAGTQHSMGTQECRSILYRGWRWQSRMHGLEPVWGQSGASLRPVRDGAPLCTSPGPVGGLSVWLAGQSGTNLGSVWGQSRQSGASLGPVWDLSGVQPGATLLGRPGAPLWGQSGASLRPVRDGAAIGEGGATIPELWGQSGAPVCIWAERLHTLPLSVYIVL